MELHIYSEDTRRDIDISKVKPDNLFLQLQTPNLKTLIVINHKRWLKSPSEQAQEFKPRFTAGNTPIRRDTYPTGFQPVGTRLVNIW